MKKNPNTYYKIVRKIDDRLYSCTYSKKDAFLKVIGEDVILEYGTHITTIAQPDSFGCLVFKRLYEARNFIREEGLLIYECATYGDPIEVPILRLFTPRYIPNALRINRDLILDAKTFTMRPPYGTVGFPAVRLIGVAHC